MHDTTAEFQARKTIADVSMIVLMWILARLPILVYTYPPQVQVDSLSYRPFWISLFNPHNPPFYGTFLAVLSPGVVILIQHGMVLVSALCLYEIGRRSTSRLAGLISGVFVVVYGDLVLYAHTFMSEIPFNFFLSLSLVALWYAIDQRSLGWYFVCGICIGMAALVRPIIQYQGIVLAAALFPLGAWRVRQAMLYGYSVASLFAGFLIMVLPVAGLTRILYGDFTLSSGLGNVMTYRLVWDEKAPLAKVEVDDPVLTRVRDYLASVGPNPDVIYLKAYEHIRLHILVPEGKETLGDMVFSFFRNPGLSEREARRFISDNRRIDQYIKRLWRRYVSTYPVEYLRFSLREVLSVFRLNSSFHYSEGFSRRTLSEHPGSKFESVRSRWSVSEQGLVALDKIYYPLARMLTVVLVVPVLLVGLVDLASSVGRRRRFMLCVYATMAYVALPQFLVSVGILRYRYPFDLLYGIVLGVVASRTWDWLKGSRIVTQGLQQ